MIFLTFFEKGVLLEAAIAPHKGLQKASTMHQNKIILKNCYKIMHQEKFNDTQSSQRY